METSAAVERFGKTDFFGVLTPGFYMLYGVVLVMAVTSGLTPEALLTALNSWSVPVLVLFASYLLGSLPRAFVVDLTDRMTVRVFHRFRRLVPNSFQGRLLQDSFPYCSVLEETIKKLSAHKAIPPEWKDFPVPLANEPGQPAVFDYWKAVLCAKARDSFAFVESLEARVRFFVGVIWASLLGLAASLVALLACAVRALLGVSTGGWVCISGTLLVVSAVVLVVFGRRLRFVRGEEAIQVLLAYLPIYYAAQAGSSAHRAEDGSQ